MLQIHLLGSLRADIGGVTLPPAKRRHTDRLWAFLLLHGLRAPLPREDIAFTLWPESTEPRGALRLHLHMLGDRLPEHAPGQPWLLVGTKTIQWNPEGHFWLDVATLVAACAAPAVAVDRATLVAAADLYQGPLLADWDEPWLELDRAHLEACARELLRRLAEQYAGAGDYDSARHHAERYLVMDPLDESAHRQLMALHLAAGDRGSALRQFEACRHVLAVEVGVEPEPATLALADHIRSATAGEALQAIRRVVTGAAPGEQDPDRPPRVGESPVGAHRVHALRARLTTARLVTVTGPPGCGKSRIALAAIAGDAPPFHVRWLDVAALPADEPLAGAVAAIESRFGATPATAERPRLLLLDNCDLRLAECAELLESVLGRADEERVLVTSRETVGVGDEAVWRVPLLACPDPDDSEQALATSEVVQLFLRHYPTDLGCLRGLGSDLCAIATVCAQLDGLPLAIALAARWAAYNGLPALVTGLDDALTLLDSVGRLPDGRFADLSTTLAWTSAHLTAPERMVLARLARLDGGFSYAQAERAVQVTGSAEPVPWLLDVMHGLVERSWLESNPGRGGKRRYRLLGVVRQWARRPPV